MSWCGLLLVFLLADCAWAVEDSTWLAEVVQDGTPQSLSVEFANSLSAAVLRGPNGTTTVLDLAHSTEYQWATGGVCRQSRSTVSTSWLLGAFCSGWMLKNENASIYSLNSTTILGINVRQQEIRFRRDLCDIQATVAFSDGWTVQGLSVTPISCHVSVTKCSSERSFSAIFTQWLPSLFTPASPSFQALGSCNNTQPLPSQPTVTGRPPTISVGKPFPSLVKEFTTLILVTMMDEQRSFTVDVAFSEGQRKGSTTLTLPLAGGKRSWTVTVDGSSQIAYQVVSDGTCSKSVFAETLLSDATDLLLSSTVSPRYLGSFVVRGMLVSRWHALVQDAQVTWDFERESADGIAPILVRMTVIGSGRSPLFPHHPFLLRGKVTSPEMRSACSSFFAGFDASCASGRASYSVSYDFIQFRPSSTIIDVPLECRRPEQVPVSAYPLATNCPEGLEPTALFGFCFLAAVVGGVATALVICLQRRRADAK